ncbi:MAG: hypothetical protein L3J22_04360 [Xanthomonadales bacterium]|nr:hypothetical protein [Xanthomonadales bacterium]
MKLLTFVFLILFSMNTYAYLDPGTGSVLLQVILGGVAAIGVIIKMYWHRLRAALGFAQKDEEEDKDDE